MKAHHLFFLLLVGITSCAKKYGCTDEDALNYSSKAESEDHSCLYEKRIYYGWSYISEANWNYHEYQYLEVFLNNTIDDTIPSGIFGEHHMFSNTIMYDLPQVTRIRVVADNGDEIHDGVYLVDKPGITSALSIGD